LLSGFSEGKREFVVVKCGIFYEFVKSDEFYSDKLDVCWRLELGINYV
jgi:hypothetical protein